MYRFHLGVVPRIAGLFAEPELLAAYQNSLKRQGKGLHLSMAVLEEYIRSEQQLKRVIKYAHCVSRPVVNPSGELVELVGSIMAAAHFIKEFK